MKLQTQETQNDTSPGRRKIISYDVSSWRESNKLGWHFSAVSCVYQRRWKQQMSPVNVKRLILETNLLLLMVLRLLWVACRVGGTDDSPCIITSLSHPSPPILRPPRSGRTKTRRAEAPPALGGFKAYQEPIGMFGCNSFKANTHSLYDYFVHFLCEQSLYALMLISWYKYSSPIAFQDEICARWINFDNFSFIQNN